MRKAGKAFITWVVAVALLSGAPSAFGHETKVPSSTSFRLDGVEFAGKLKSDAKRCVKERVVRLFSRDTGFVTDTVSDTDGEWSIPAVFPEGNYYVKVRKSIGGDGSQHQHICRATRSKRDVTVAGPCEQIFISGGSDPAEKLSVDDDWNVYLDDVLIYSDTDGVASDYDPVNLGAPAFSRSLRVVASNSAFFGTGPVSIDPIWVHCRRGPDDFVSVSLDPTGIPQNTETASASEVFYDQTFTVPDFASPR